MPPFEGPRAMLWVTRWPRKTPTAPLSIVTGIETSTDFLHFSRTRIRFGSIPNVCPTRRSVWRASASGFSRRCVGASAVDIAVSFSRGRAGVYPSPSANPEADRLRLGRPLRRQCDHTKPVRPLCERPAARAAAGQPEGVAPGQHVAESSDEPEPLAAAPQLDVEERDRTQLAAAGEIPDLSGLNG